jgi:hypothetical protein
VLGRDGGVRAIGAAPAASGSPGGPLTVPPGAWARYDRLDFGAGASIDSVSARVFGAGTLVWALGRPDGPILASMVYNVSAVCRVTRSGESSLDREGRSCDTPGAEWAVLSTSNVSRSQSLQALQTIYIVFFPANTTHPKYATKCDVGTCSVEGEICPPDAPGSESIGYICCGVSGKPDTHGNWCPDSSIPCGPLPRRPGEGKPMRNYGTGCMNLTAGNSTGPVVSYSPMRLDYWSISPR